jgi:Holliday junction DNA helicase RuvA
LLFIPKDFMLGSVFGKVIHQGSNFVIVETGSGVGYRVFVGNQTLPESEAIRFFTYHHIREDMSDLYGFTEPRDLAIFELLLTVSGVGPKMAQTLVTHLGRTAITQALAEEDSALFKSVSGIGQKVADKIIVELRGKVKTILSDPTAKSSADIIDALASLGYRQNEIIEAIRSIDSSLKTEDKLKQALRLLAH